MNHTAKYVVDGTAVKISVDTIHDQNILVHAKQSIYVGTTSSVSSTTGFLMDNGDKIEFSIDGDMELWAISATTSSDVYVFRKIT